MAHRKHMNRQSYFEVAESRKDDNHQLGFAYHENDNLIKKTLSNFFFGDEKRDSILSKFSTLYTYLIDSVKNVKKTFMYSIPRNSRKLN